MNDLWRKDFSAFLEEVGLPPSSDHTLYRIDYDKDFEPGNMHWYTRKEHCEKLFAHRNRSRAVRNQARNIEVD
jgi:hypothetical protein